MIKPKTLLLFLKFSSPLKRFSSSSFLEKHSRKLLPFSPETEFFGDPFSLRQQHLERLSTQREFSHEMVLCCSEHESEIETLRSKSTENLQSLLTEERQKPLSEEVSSKEIAANSDSLYYFKEEPTGREFLIVGVIHIYQESALQVINCVEDFKPDALVLELCTDRLNHLERKYEKFNPGTVYDTLKKNPKTLKYLFKPSLEFVVGVEGTKRLGTYCEVIDGDLSKYDITNTLQRYRDQCRCSKTVASLFKQMSTFFGLLYRGVFLYLLRRLAYANVKIEKGTLNDFGLLKPQKATACIEDKLQFEREYHFFTKLINAPRSKRVLGVVGLYHLKSIKTFFQIYERMVRALPPVDAEQFMKNLEFEKMEDRESYELALGERSKKLEEELMFFEKIRFCAQTG